MTLVKNRCDWSSEHAMKQQKDQKIVEYVSGYYKLYEMMMCSWLLRNGVGWEVE